jgi:hypothetical protein
MIVDEGSNDYLKKSLDRNTQPAREFAAEQSREKQLLPQQGNA